MEWVLWCGCPLPETGVPAAPDRHRLRAERCAVCGSEVAQNGQAYRIPASDAAWVRQRAPRTGVRA